jgi:NADPH:quinone reductase-like Zn-dependent oxidoreductase
VTRFKVGDRVVAIALGITNGAANSAEGAFQKVVLLRDHMVAAIPDDVRFEEALVIPWDVSTAACRLYQKDHFAMDLLRVGGEEKKMKRKTSLQRLRRITFDL